MKKLVTIIITICTFLLPICGVFANSNPDYSGFEFVYDGGFTEDLLLRSQIETDILMQVEILENSFGIQLDKETTFKILPFEKSAFNALNKNRHNLVNCIISTDFKESTGKANPIFSSILYSIWPKCPSTTINILSLYLTFKYLEIDSERFVAEIRYAYPNYQVSKNLDKSKDFDTNQINTIFLAATRIFKLEKEIETAEFPKFLYSAKFGISQSVERHLDMNIEEFIMNQNIETKTPSEETKKLLLSVDTHRTKLWSDIPKFASNYDYKIRMMPSMALYQATIQIAIGQDSKQVNSTLNAIDEFFKWKKHENNKAWMILATSIFLLAVLLFISLKFGIQFKPSKAAGK